MLLNDNGGNCKFRSKFWYLSSPAYSLTTQKLTGTNKWTVVAFIWWSILEMKAIPVECLLCERVGVEAFHT